MKDRKYLPIKEFRELGYLQEVNRQFLHPLGLALEISQNEDGTEFISGVWDLRNDPEGIIFDLENSDSERKINFIKKAIYIQNEFDNRFHDRMNNLGFEIEPIT